jgi:hypothetical protein
VVQIHSPRPLFSLSSQAFTTTASDSILGAFGFNCSGTLNPTPQLAATSLRNDKSALI